MTSYQEWLERVKRDADVHAASFGDERQVVIAFERGTIGEGIAALLAAENGLPPQHLAAIMSMNIPFVSINRKTLKNLLRTRAAACDCRKALCTYRELLNVFAEKPRRDQYQLITIRKPEGPRERDKINCHVFDVPAKTMDSHRLKFLHEHATSITQAASQARSLFKTTDEFVILVCERANLAHALAVGELVQSITGKSIELGCWALIVCVPRQMLIEGWRKLCAKSNISHEKQQQVLMEDLTKTLPDNTRFDLVMLDQYGFHREFVAFNWLAQSQQTAPIDQPTDPKLVN